VVQLDNSGTIAIYGTNLDNFNYLQFPWWSVYNYHCSYITSTEIHCPSWAYPGHWGFTFYNYYGEYAYGGFDFTVPPPTIDSSTYDVSSGTLTLNGSNLDQFYNLYVYNQDWSYSNSFYSYNCSYSATQVTCQFNLSTPGQYYIDFYDNWSNWTTSSFEIVENITGNVLLLKMDGADNGTTFTDSSPRNLTVSTSAEGNTATTSTSQIRFGSSSGYFDGGAWLTVADNAALHLSNVDFTIEGWFYPARNYPASVLWSHRSYGSQYGGALLYADSSGELRYVVANADASNWQTVGDPSTGLTWSTNQWQHIALVRTGNTLTAYLNGVAGTPITISGAIGSNGDFAVAGGASHENIGQAFEGYLDEFKITRGTALYTANFTPPQLPVNSNTVLLMHMDGANNSTNFVDDSDYNFNVVPQGSPTVSTSKSKIGGASAKFIGSSELKIDSNPAFNFGTGDFTVEGWVNLNSMGNDLFMISAGANGGLFLGYHSQTKLGIGRRGVAWDFEVSVSLGTNKWNHIAASRSGSTLRLFFNGLLVGTTTNSENYDLSSGNTFIGSHGGSYYLDGYIDELRVTRGKALYTASFAPPTSEFISEDSFTGDGIYDEFCYDNFVSLGAVGGGTGYCSGDNTFYIGGVPYPGLNSSGTGASGDYYFVNAAPANGYINNACYNNGLNTFGLVAGSGWCSGDSTYYLEGVATNLDSTGQGSYQGKYYVGGILANRVVSDDTVLLLHMDGSNGSTNFVDSSASNVTVTASGGAQISTAKSKFGGASGYINALNSYPSTQNIIKTGSLSISADEDFTIETWYYQTAPTYYNSAPTILIVPSGFHCTLWDSGARRIYTHDGTWMGYTTQGYYSSAYPTLNTWHHLAVTRQSGTLRTFLDGQLLETGSFTKAITGDFTLGAYDFAGYFDEFRVLKGSAAYTSNFSPPTSAFNPAVGCYHDGILTNDLDSSNTGTCSGDGKYYVNGAKANGTYDGVYYVDGTPANQVVGGKTVLLLHMDGTNNSTTFTDSSGFSHPPTSNGPIISTAQSKFGGASAYFSGTGNQYLSIPSHGDFGFGTGDFTIEFWARPTGISSFNTLININNYQNGILFRHGWNTDSLYLVNQNQNWNPSSNLPSNVWTHVALVRTSGVVKVYINGSSVVTWTRGVDLGSSASVMIGASAHNTSETYVGYIDELRVSKGKALYTSNFTPPSATLTSGATCYSNGVATNDLNSSGTGTCSGDGKYYVNGVKANGTYNGLYYIEGSPAHGFVQLGLTASSNTSLLLKMEGADGSTTFTDSSSNTFSPTSYGSPNISTAQRKFGSSSAYFHGSGSYSTSERLEFAGATAFDMGTGDFTVEGWFYQTGTSQDIPMAIELGYHGGGNGLGMWFHPNAGTTEGVSSWYSGGSSATGPATSLEQWTHAAWVRKNGMLTIYINGVGGTPVSMPNNLNGSYLRVGGGGWQNWYNYEGYIDDLRITKGQALYQSNFTPPTGSTCFVNGVATNTMDSNGNGTCLGVTYINGIPQ
jgi:hypothetical protein